MFRKLAIASVLSALALAPAYAAEQYTFDNNHSQIRMGYSHFGFSNIEISFQTFEGELLLDTEDWGKSTVSVTIPVESIYTGVPKFTDHLKSPDFFEVAKFPTATFKSTGVEKAGDGKLKVTGDLTIHGVTKPVTLDVTVNKVGIHPGANKAAAGFDATTTIKRSDFSLGKYTPGVTDDVSIEITTETYKAEANEKAEAKE